MNVPKWIASATPRDQRQPQRARAPASRCACAAANGASTTAAAPVRQNAIASAGAEQAAISGGDVDAPSTPRASSP